MICALTHDDPVNDCGDREGARILVGLLAVAVVLSARDDRAAACAPPSSRTVEPGFLAVPVKRRSAAIPARRRDLPSRPHPPEYAVRPVDAGIEDVPARLHDGDDHLEQAPRVAAALSFSINTVRTPARSIRSIRSILRQAGGSAAMTRKSAGPGSWDCSARQAERSVGSTVSVPLPRPRSRGREEQDARSATVHCSCADRGSGGPGSAVCCAVLSREEGRRWNSPRAGTSGTGPPGSEPCSTAVRP